MNDIAMLPETFKRSNVQTFQPIHVVWTRFGNVEIYASRSTDGGASWSAERPVFVRSGLPNRDLGYPSLALRSDGSLFVAYYAQDAENVTGIHASVLPAGWADGGIERIA